MAKLTLNNLASLTNETTAIASINANYDLIEEALENTFSLDGTSPNTIADDIDMDSNRILNLPEPTSDQEAATKAYVDSVAGVDIGDITSYVTAAAASATAAATSETNAATSAASLTGTSTTSVGIGTGSKAFTTQASKAFNTGVFVLVVSDADPTTNYMYGQVASYSGTSLTVTVSVTGGSGTYADWTIYVAGARGATGTASYSTLDIAGASAMTDVATGDSIPVYDVSTTTNKRATVNELFEAVNTFTAETSVDTADVLPLYDASASTADKATVGNVFGAINTFTADSSPAMSADYVATYDASASGVKKVLLNKLGTGRQTLFLPASAFTPNTTSGCAALAQLDAGNARNYKYLAFDSTSVEYASAVIATPKGWNAGAIYGRFLWTHPATTTNFGVVWYASLICTGDNEALGTVHSTLVGVADTGGTTNNLYISDEGTVSPAGATKRDMMHILLQRDPSHASDTMAVDAYFLGLELYYTTDTNTDD